jgi:hypothetical protein
MLWFENATSNFISSRKSFIQTSTSNRADLNTVTVIDTLSQVEALGCGAYCTDKGSLECVSGTAPTATCWPDIGNGSKEAVFDVEQSILRRWNDGRNVQRGSCNVSPSA